MNTKRKTTKITSLLLALVMMLSVFFGMSTNAFAHSGALVYDGSSEISNSRNYVLTFHANDKGAWRLIDNNKYKSYEIVITSDDGTFDVDLPYTTDGPDGYENKRRVDFFSTMSYANNMGTKEMYISSHYDEAINIRVKIYDVTVYPNTPKIKKLSAKKKQLTASWKKDNSVKGYQLQYSTGRGFNRYKTVTVNSPKKIKKTVKKLKKNTKYYVRVRSYTKLYGRKYYSDWSKIKAVKTK